MKLKRLLATTFALSVLALPAAYAEGGHDAHSGSHAAASAEAAMTDGVVKKVDKSAGKVTLSHGPLTNLGMPAMTMVFRVKEAAWLGQMKAGDKIRFVADKVNGILTVVQFEAAK
ncbi:MAG: copper-binding protein [Sulfuricella sp.]